MNQFEAMLSQFLPAGSLLPLLVDFTWKATCVALVAVPLMVMLRRSSASARHLGWLLVLAVMLTAPVLSGFVPARSENDIGAEITGPEAGQRSNALHRPRSRLTPRNQN